MFDTTTFDKTLANIISPRYAFEHNILPISMEDRTLTIGLINSGDQALVKEICFDTGLRIKVRELPGDVILRRLKELYPDYENENSGRNGAISESINVDSSTVDFVNQIIIGAVKSAASDIHFEALENSFRIRYRIDGHLREISDLPPEKKSTIVSRLKILANLDISEKRRPQDGRFRFKTGNKTVDIRISSLPTNFGEKVVLRILDKSQLQLDLRKLGLSDEHFEMFTKKIRTPYGMILVTGPTGSGKTTTLYASLQHIHDPEKNILTVEDPIEYNLNGINQCHVKPEIGFNFANALRSFLRQDPDIIMVGEIRDKETAEIAIRSSLTGHLVFSTLHTNDSIAGISRLIDMGIEPYLISSSIKLIAAQRLIRNLCSCKREVRETEINEKLNCKIIYDKNGCEKCNYTGYSGRSAIFEMFEISDEISELISANTPISEIRSAAAARGFKSMKDSGFEKIKNGITNYEEVMREILL